MSEEIPEGVADGNPVLQKQLGCWTVIFQMLDGCHGFHGKLVAGHNRKKLLAGQSCYHDDNLRKQAITSSETATPMFQERNSNKSQNKHRTSSDSSGASFSSSTWSSSSTSLPAKRATLLEHSITDSYQVNNSGIICKINSPLQSSQDSIKFRDVVNGSVYGSQRSSFKNIIREELANHVPTPKHSWEPFSSSPPRDATHVVGIGRKVRMLTGNESPRFQGKIADASCCIGSARELPRSSSEPRSGSFNSALSVAHRFSYDGRDSSRSVPRETCRSPMKSREAPRLSLDSRESTIRSPDYNLKKDRILEKFSNYRNSNVEQEYRNYEKYPSVVVKLMGLEEIPNSRSAVHAQMDQIESHTDEDLDLFDGESSRKLKGSKKHDSCQSKRNSIREHISPPHRHSEVIKPILSSRFQIKTDSNWQQDSSRFSPSKSFSIQVAHADEALDFLHGELPLMINQGKQNKKFPSPQSSFSGNISPQWRISEVTKAVSNSGIQIKRAPSNQQDSSHSPQRTAFDTNNGQVVTSTSLSVYGEIEKKVKELDFQPSNKDLRALKHVLKAIQVKGLTETEKAAASNHISPKNFDIQNRRFERNLNLANGQVSQNHGLISSPTRRTKKTGDFQPPKEIRITQVMDSFNAAASSVPPFDRSSDLSKLRVVNSMDSKSASGNNINCKGPIPKLVNMESGTRILSRVGRKTNARDEAYGSQKGQVRSMQGLLSPDISTKENAGSQRGSSNSLSRRMQQKKFELEKRCRLPTLSSRLNKPNRQPIVKQVELAPSGRKQRPKSAYLKECDGQSSKVCSKTRNLSCEGDVISMQSHSDIASASAIDEEIMSPDKSSEMHNSSIRQGCESPCRTALDNMVFSLEQKRSMLSSRKDGSPSKFTTAAPEQRSPVSVLDASLYGDDSPPSPLRKSSISVQDDAVASNNRTQHHNVCSEEELSVKDNDCLLNNKQLSSTFRINHRKLESIDHLVNNLGQQPSSSDCKSTSDQKGYVFEDANPDHRYIHEILLASGLLLGNKSSSSAMLCHFHPSANLLNPNLFMALEDMKTRSLESGSTQENVVQSKFNKDKLHRKLVFETMNEILARRLEMEAEPWIQVNSLAGLIPSGRQLTRELCLEISQLQADASNTISGLEMWMDCGKEISLIVLDIERMIFKDMIDEMVRP